VTASIAIIGTEGSGKTVLTTTLAKRLSTIDSRGVFLNPQDVTTLKYVQSVWDTLQDGDWPPSTTPGKLFELRWKLELVGQNTKAEVRLLDPAGQDLRLLFAEDRYADPTILPEALQKLAKYCRSADIVLFLINLGDFIGEGDPKKRNDNQAAIKGAMDHLSADGRPRRFCVVLTQVDRYKDYAAAHGGWLSVAQDAIPIVFSAYVAGGDTVLFPVSAVNMTAVEADDGSGRSQERPAPGFGSDGFDDLVDWMTTQVQEVRRKALPFWLVWLGGSAPDFAQRIEQDWLSWIEENMRTIKRALWGGLAVFLLLLLLLVRSCGGPQEGGGKGPELPPTHPQPVVISKWNKEVRGGVTSLWDHNVISYVEVRNEGAAGNIVVESTLTERGVQKDRRSQKKFLNSGETEVFVIRLDIYSCDNPYTVDPVARVP
jgi:hypothetical protein